MRTQQSAGKRQAEKATARKGKPATPTVTSKRTPARPTVGGKSAPASAAIEIGSLVFERDRMVAEAAYYRAERRGFAPGNELADWLEAEADIERLLRH